MTDHINSDDRDGITPEAAIAQEVSRDRVFSDAVRLARSIADTSMAAITLVDDTSLWFLATSGFEVRRAAKAGTFCERTVAAGTRVIVQDALADPRFATASFVTAGPQMRYYAGIPMTSRDRQVLGTLCVADHRPNLELDEECFRHLSLVLEIATDRLEHLYRAAELAARLSKARALSGAISSEAVSLVTEAERLTATARTHELATDAAMQGVRQVILLDREIHDRLSRVPVRSTAATSKSEDAAGLRSHLQLHNAISLTVEDDIDMLVGSAANVRMRSGTLEAQGQRIVDLGAVLDDALASSDSSRTD